MQPRGAASSARAGAGRAPQPHAAVPPPPLARAAGGTAPGGRAGVARARVLCPFESALFKSFKRTRLLTWRSSSGANTFSNLSSIGAGSWAVTAAAAAAPIETASAGVAAGRWRNTLSVFGGPRTGGGGGRERRKARGQMGGGQGLAEHAVGQGGGAAVPSTMAGWNSSRLWHRASPRQTVPPPVCCCTPTPPALRPARPHLRMHAAVPPDPSSRRRPRPPARPTCA